MSVSKVWEQIESLLKDGISVIPVRDKDETGKNGAILTKKSPYVFWAKYQSEIISKEELWFLMNEKYNTEAIATICGKVSGNLEAIDIDVKWAPGIAKEIFAAIKEYDETLLKTLRINKTPSGGFHILYRIDGDVPKSSKIAGREATEEELQQNAKEKNKYFIETRGEGGYVLAPPSLGYLCVQDVPIPRISNSQREGLFSILKTFDSLLREEKTYNALAKTDSDYYDVNPFEDYNKKDGERTLLDCGWKYFGKNSKALLFTRPGSKSGGIHAAYILDKGVYYCFTPNTELVQNRCYNPATVLAILKYNGDKKLLRAELVRQKYGQLRPLVERKLVRDAVLTGNDLPGNVSDVGLQQYQSVSEKLKTDNPHGIFWKLNDKNKPEIDREDFYMVAANLGFRLHQGELVRIVGNWIHRVDARLFNDEMKTTIVYSDDPEMCQNVKNEFEAFIQRSGEFSIGRIKLLEESAILEDTKSECYKFFTNGYKKITCEDISTHSYEEAKGLLWADRVQPRAYVIGESGGKYIEFLNLACSLNDSNGYIEKVIGYLSHEYKDSATSYIIVLVEETNDPKQGGGTGKNIFSNLFKLTTTLTNKPGVQVKFDEKFLQSWNHERIFCISDVPKNFDFLFLKEPSSGDGIMKKLYKDEVVIPNKDMPKFLLQTNYSYEVKDGGLARRIKQIEFTDFFTKCGGVDIHFGGMFPDDWNELDWIGYDNFIDHCVQVWLRGGRKIEKKELTATGWQKQFDQTFPQLREFIEDNWENWKTNTFILSSQFSDDYEKYCKNSNINPRFKASPQKMNDALSSWCEHNGYEYSKNSSVRIAGESMKCKEFLPKAPF